MHLGRGRLVLIGGLLVLNALNAGAAAAAPGGNGNGNGNAYGYGYGHGNDNDVGNPDLPSVAATPELDSLALFGSGALGLAGYALMRLRANRRSRKDPD